MREIRRKVEECAREKKSKCRIREKDEEEENKNGEGHGWKRTNETKTERMMQRVCKST